MSASQERCGAPRPPVQSREMRVLGPTGKGAEQVKAVGQGDGRTEPAWRLCRTTDLLQKGRKSMTEEPTSCPEADENFTLYKRS